MNPLHERIRERLRHLKKSARRASLDSGLSEFTIATLLKKPEQSQTIETISKLAIGLQTTPEWIAFGIENTAPCKKREDGEPNSSAGTQPLYRSQLRDTDRIQVSIGDLRKASLHVLRLAEQESGSHDTLVAVLLATLATRPNAYAVRRLREFDRSHSVAEEREHDGRA